MNAPFIKKLLSRKITVVAIFILTVMILTAIFGPYLCRRDPTSQDISHRYAGISADYWLGTDYVGRDTFTRLVYGSQYSLSTSFFGVAIGCVIGVFMGLMAGYYGGVIDAVVSRITELLMAVPGILLAILTIAVIGRGNTNTAVAVAFSVIASFTRITRSTVISVKNSDFVKSCYIIGESDRRIIFTHILPNAISFIIVTFTLNLGAALLTVSSLSFLGIGVKIPIPEWGAMISSAKEAMRTYPLGILAPGLCITLFVMSASILGDGLRDALDPKQN